MDNNNSNNNDNINDHFISNIISEDAGIDGSILNLIELVKDEMDRNIDLDVKTGYYNQTTLVNLIFDASLPGDNKHVAIQTTRSRLRVFRNAMRKAGLIEVGANGYDYYHPASVVFLNGYNIIKNTFSVTPATFAESWISLYNSKRTSPIYKTSLQEITEYIVSMSRDITELKNESTKSFSEIKAEIDEIKAETSEILEILKNSSTEQVEALSKEIQEKNDIIERQEYRYKKILSEMEDKRMLSEMEEKNKRLAAELAKIRSACEELADKAATTGLMGAGKLKTEAENKAQLIKNSISVIEDSAKEE